MPTALVLLALIVLALAQNALAAPDDDPGSLAQQVATLVDAGRYEEAIPIQKKLVEIATRTLGSEHPQTALTLSNLAFFYGRVGDHAKAETLYRQAIAIQQKVLGAEHLDAAVTLSSLGSFYTTLDAVC